MGNIGDLVEGVENCLREISVFTLFEHEKLGVVSIGVEKIAWIRFGDTPVVSWEETCGETCVFNAPEVGVFAVGVEKFRICGVSLGDTGAFCELSSTGLLTSSEELNKISDHRFQIPSSIILIYLL